jgi:hypothetical protein
MSRIVLLATHVTRKGNATDWVHGLVVCGCALALIMARSPLGF